MLASLTLLTLGIADASIALLSLTRNVKMLNVKRGLVLRGIGPFLSAIGLIGLIVTVKLCHR